LNQPFFRLFHRPFLPPSNNNINNTNNNNTNNNINNTNNNNTNNNINNTNNFIYNMDTLTSLLNLSEKLKINATDIEFAKELDRRDKLSRFRQEFFIPKKHKHQEEVREEKETEKEKKKEKET